MKPFPCQGMMSSYPQLKEVKKNHPQAGWISDRVVQHTPQAL